MAVGDVKSGMGVIATNGNFDIRPPVGEEWVVHNVYYTANGWIYFRMVDAVGNSTIQFDSDNTAGARLGACFHLTNNQYLRITNQSGSNQTFGYDGIQTK